MQPRNSGQRCVGQPGRGRSEIAIGGREKDRALRRRGRCGRKNRDRQALVRQPAPKSLRPCRIPTDKVDLPAAQRQRDRDLKARLESLRERDEVDKGPDGNYAELSDDTKAQLKHVQQLLANKHQR